MCLPVSLFTINQLFIFASVYIISFLDTHAVLPALNVNIMTLLQLLQLHHASLQ